MASPESQPIAPSDYYQKFQDIADGLKPEIFRPQGNELLVAALRSGLSPLNSRQPTDFVWVKCKPEAKVATIKQSIVGRLKLESCVLLACGKVPSDDTCIRDLQKGSDVIPVQIISHIATSDLSDRDTHLAASSQSPSRLSILSLPGSPLELEHDSEAQRVDQAIKPEPVAQTDLEKTLVIQRTANEKYHNSDAHDDSKLYHNGEDAYKQHCAALGDVSEGTNGESLFGKWETLYRTQHELYDLIAHLDVPLSILEKFRAYPGSISGDLNKILRQWKRSADDGTKIRFHSFGQYRSLADMPSPSTDIQEHINDGSLREEFDQVSKPVVQPRPSAFSLHELAESIDPDKLEILVDTSLSFYQLLEKDLLEAGDTSPEAAHWLERIQLGKSVADRVRTVIGVVGNTGSGKSSLINALLDEECLVPTNSMRACTSVVTEISFNHDQGNAYRGEVEFVSTEAWQRELEALFHDLGDPSGQGSGDTMDNSSNAGVALAKIKSVYPHMTKEAIISSSVKQLVDEVSNVLGTKRLLSADNASTFYNCLQEYVDSKEKTRQKNSGPQKITGPQTRELWPLIKVVRIFTRASVLATGAVIVDLPGVHDANAARAAVAESYLRQCTALWVAAPIIRAVDDKAAKTLLGESFKRQLKLDGGYTNVTFICTKSDDISVKEVIRSLDLKDQPEMSLELVDKAEAQKQSLQHDIKVLREAQKYHTKTLKQLATEIRDLKDNRKRKGSETDHFLPKRSRLGTAGSERQKSEEGRLPVDIIQRDNNDSESSSSIVPDGSKLQTLETQRKAINEKKASNADMIDDLTQQCEELDDAIVARRLRVTRACIDSRNEYTQSAIQEDFACGMRELYQEIDQENNNDDDPDRDFRDYDEIARSLPVFCISARAYQKLAGRNKQDQDVSSFETPEQTQVPALREHCKRLTVEARRTACKTFLADFSQTLNSLMMWADVHAHLSTEEQKGVQEFLDANLAKLGSQLRKNSNDLIEAMAQKLKACLFDTYRAGIGEATSKAAATAIRWGQPINRDNRKLGGHQVGTYKAICRRKGVYTNAHGHHDFNTDLLEPFLDRISNGWERVFMRQLPSLLADFARQSGASIDMFHETIRKMSSDTGKSFGAVSLLQAQLGTHKQSFKSLETAASKKIVAKQRDINRQFAPVVASAMEPAYDLCCQESGKGSFSRMKGTMETHVSECGESMFKSSAEAVRKLIKTMLTEIDVMTKDRCSTTLNAIKHDYNGAIIGSEAAVPSHLIEAEKQLKAKLLAVMLSIRLAFGKIAVGDMGPAAGMSEAGSDAKDVPEKPKAEADAE